MAFGNNSTQQDADLSFRTIARESNPALRPRQAGVLSNRLETALLLTPFYRLAIPVHLCYIHRFRLSEFTDLVLSDYVEFLNPPGAQKPPVYNPLWMW